MEGSRRGTAGFTETPVCGAFLFTLPPRLEWKHANTITLLHFAALPGTGVLVAKQYHPRAGKMDVYRLGLRERAVSAASRLSSNMRHLGFNYSPFFSLGISFFFLSSFLESFYFLSPARLFRVRGSARGWSDL